MTTIVDFLRARLDGEERTARAVGPVRYYVYRDPRRWEARHDDGAVLASGEPDLRDHRADALVDHNGHHVPGRVLAGIEGRRRIVDLHADRHDAASVATLRALALPYGDHPACDPAWLEPVDVEAPTAPPAYDPDATVRVALSYPGVNGNATSLTVGLEAVRAADELVLMYDFNRDGWSVRREDFPDDELAFIGAYDDRSWVDDGKGGEVHVSWGITPPG
ncbi:DUF6221 family protein [Aeromicrobium sp. Leaf291]|uniref:DUF6221 family protein n=1 Tax=Aeromicrobium sp. Leaf291 TaxID=1736325 RepID=UPI0006FDDAD1|nr:DUF6221 family protein [Aeromicrobium sp. Leaf291]KQP81620.1 hypothetical protein ASF35_16445 [Aeromicrobium sp. Leaf291]